MARPIQITILGDSDDLSRSLEQVSADAAEMGREVGEAMEEVSREAAEMGDAIANGVSEGAGDAEREIGRLGETLRAAALAAGVAVGAGLAGGIAEAMEQETANDLLSAQIGASPEMAEEFGGIAGRLYAKAYGENIGEVNDAIKAIWQNGVVDEDAATADIERVSAKAMDLSQILGEDVGKVGVAVGQMLKTGMAKDADEAFDILVRGAQQGANKSEDLLDTFNEYGTQFRKFGLDGKTAMGLLSQGLQAGARDADIVADAFKEFSLRATDGSTTSAEGFKAIGLNAQEMTAIFARGGPEASQALDLVLDRLRVMKDPVAQNAAAVALFGTQAEDLGAALFSLDPSSAVASLGDVAGAADEVGKTLHSNASTELKIFWRSLKQNVVDFIADNVIPVLAKLNDGVRALGSAWDSTIAFVDRYRVPLGILAGVIATVLLPAMVAWGVSATVNGAKVVAGWVTSGAASTTSAATQVAAHWATIGGWIKAAAQAVASGAVQVAQWIRMGAVATAQAVRMAAAWLIATAPLSVIIVAIAAFVLLLIAHWDTIVDATVGAFQKVFGFIANIFGQIRDLFVRFDGPQILGRAWELMKQGLSSAMEGMKNIARSGLDAVFGFFSALPGRVWGMGGSVLSAATAFGGWIIDGLASGLSKVGNFAWEIGAVVGNAVKDAINGIIGMLNGAIPNDIGWGPASIDLPDNPIPSIRAMGGPASGWTTVGERGKEDVFLPKGSRVVPNHASRRDGGVVVNVTSNANPFEIGRSVAWALRTQG